jgi:hypothetical protein
MTAISKEMVAKEPSVPSGYLYKSRVRTEPTNVTQPQWANVLWTRLEVMIDEMAGCCIKVRDMHAKRNSVAVDGFGL